MDKKFENLEINIIIKYILGIIALIFAVLRLLDIKGLSSQIDNTFLLIGLRLD